MLVIRQIWFLGLVSLVSLTCLVSCGGGSDDDLLAPQPAVQGGNDMSPITFGGRETEEATVTRAGTPLSAKGITTFMAWGYKDMSYNEGTKTYGDNQTVMFGNAVKYFGASSINTTASNTNGWEYVNQQPGVEAVEQSIKYWDWSAKAYRYFAVTEWGGDLPGSPATGKTYYNSAATTSTSYAISMLADASSKSEMDATPYFSHLWFSNGNPTDYPDKQFGQPVTLEFLKPYARVRFIFKYVYPRVGLTLGTPSFKPTNDDDIVRKGTFTVSYPLTGAATSETFTVIPATGVGSQALDAFEEDFDQDNESKPYTVSNKGWYMVLPNNTQGSYTLTVDINSESRTAIVPAEYMKWLPGYAYTYVFKITEEGGVEIGWVEYAATPWTEMAADWDVYNW